MIELHCQNCGKLLRIPSEYRGRTGKCNGCGEAVKVPADALTSAQRAVVARNSEPVAPVEIMETDWRDDPASRKQLSYLAELGATPSMLRGLTKGRASEMIEELEDVRHAPIYQNQVSVHAGGDQHEVANAIQRQTNFHKNACGCLILLLLAPLWVPAFATIFTALLVAIGSSGSTTYEDSDYYEADTEPVVESIDFSSITVYAPPGGQYYHRRECRRIAGEGIESMTMATAIATGMAPCGICQPNIP